jgi:hypothetical protein
LNSGSEHDLKRRLKAVGLSDSAIDAAWPQWWSDAAEGSPSASLELRFSIARKLGLDARSLLDEEGTPRFVWRDEARFKNLSGESELEQAAISSFGRAVGSILLGATGAAQIVLGADANSIRDSVLRSRPFVGLLDLLVLCWTAGIPVIHLRVFPWPQKRMAAMTVRVGNRSAILLGKDSMYPAQIAFYLAHEIGHITLGHLSNETAIVDLESAQPFVGAADAEETAADRFALELLTGSADPRVLPASGTYNAPGLADAVLRSATALHVEPGTLALCFGYSTGNWAVVNSAMRFIYRSPKPVWTEVNKLAIRELVLDQIPSDSRPYLSAVLGGVAAV